MNFRIWYSMSFSVFPIWVPVYLSGNYAPPLISDSRETSVCCVGSIRVLITGIQNFSRLCMRFSVLIELFLRFWIIFFYGFAVSNIPQCPLLPQQKQSDYLCANSTLPLLLIQLYELFNGSVLKRVFCFLLIVNLNKKL